MNAYIELAKLMLPEEISKSFSLVKVEEEKVEQDKRLHLYLEELNMPPDHVDVLKPNGFYPESLMGDFPIRARLVVLHLRRRRWLDARGQSGAQDWIFICKGTRYFYEFVAFLKLFVG